MPDQVLVGGVLGLGLVLFATGAFRWRMAYEGALETVLPVIHADRRRRMWIHSWMLAGVISTAAGVSALATLADPGTRRAVATVAAAVYGTGAVCMVVYLCFGLTVIPWAAEQAVVTGTFPAGFDALRGWAGSLYVVHMLTAYVGFALLGAASIDWGALPAWLGWLGVGSGLAGAAGFVATRFAGPFNPPILAHVYPGLLGVVLLVS